MTCMSDNSMIITNHTNSLSPISKKSQLEPLKGTVLINWGCIDIPNNPTCWSNRNKELCVPVYVYSEESIKACKSLYGRCTDCPNRWKQGSWHDNHPLPTFPISNFPCYLPLKFFYTPEKKLKDNSDQIQFIFNKQLISLTCDSQKISYHDALNSDHYSYSFLEGVSDREHQQTNWFKQGVDFAKILEKKLSNVRFYEEQRAAIDAAVANAGKPFAEG